MMFHSEQSVDSAKTRVIVSKKRSQQDKSGREGNTSSMVRSAESSYQQRMLALFS